MALSIFSSHFAPTSPSPISQCRKSMALCHVDAHFICGTEPPSVEPALNPSKSSPGSVSQPSRRRLWHSIICSAAVSSVSTDPRADGSHGLSSPRQQVSQSSMYAKQRVILNTAKRMQLSGRRADALAVLQEGLVQFPSDKHLLALTASLLTKSNQLPAAKDVLQSALQHHPKHLPFVLAMAMVNMRLGQHAAGLQRLRDAQAACPDNAVLLEASGEVEAAAGHLHNARKDFQSALRLQPTMPHAYAAWARAEVACGNMQEARRVYRMGTTAVPGHAPLLHAWASLEHELGQLSLAKQLLTQALKADEQHVPSYMLLGQLEWVQGNLAAARDVWSRGNLAHGSGGCTPLLCYWAQREARGRNVKTARQLLQAALRASPGDPQTITLLAGLEDRAGARDVAEHTYSQSIKQWLSPQQQHTTGSVSAARPVAGESQCQQQQQQHPAAGTGTATAGGALVLQTSLLLPPGSRPSPGSPPPLPLLLSKAQYHLSRRDVPSALELLSLAESHDPNNGHLCHIRGLLAQREGLLTDAEGWFKRGSNAAPKEGGLLCWEGLAELFAFMGRAGDARAAWKRGAIHARSSRPRAISPLTTPDAQVTAPPASLAMAISSPTHHYATIQQSTDPDRSNGVAGAQICMAAGTGSTSDDTTMQPVLHDVIDGPVVNSGQENEQLTDGDEDDGVEGLDDSSNSNSSSVQLYVGLTSRYLRQWALFEKKNGQMDVASRLFAAAADKDPQDYRTWLAWAVFERRRGHLHTAEQLFRKGISVTPHNPHLWYAYASLLWRQKGDVNSARAALRKGTSLCPRSVALWLEWALVEWKGAGDPVAALQLIKKGAAVPVRQPYGPLYEAWGQLDREMGGRRPEGRTEVVEEGRGEGRLIEAEEEEEMIKSPREGVLQQEAVHMVAQALLV